MAKDDKGKSGRSDKGSLTGSGFEKRGGYEPTGKPVSKLPKVQTGPAPGSQAGKASGANTPKK